MRSDRERLVDILEAIEKIDRYVSRGRPAFETDEMFQVWVEYGHPAAQYALLSAQPQPQSLS